MNKLVFTLNHSQGGSIVLIANDHKELQDYLNLTYNWYKIEVNEDNVVIEEWEGCEEEIATLEWVEYVKQI